MCHGQYRECTVVRFIMFPMFNISIFSAHYASFSTYHLVSDGCLINRGYASEMKCLLEPVLCFCGSTNPLSGAATVRSVIGTWYMHGQHLHSLLAVMTFLFQKRNWPTSMVLSLCVIFCFSVKPFIFSFYVTPFAVFLIPPILRSHYSAVELCNGARGYQLNEFCPVASIYCALSQMQVTLCVCRLNLAAHVRNINQACDG